MLSKRLMRFCPLLFGWKSVPWHSWVWCVQLSGGNVGGEMVQKEEEGGRKGTVWCGDFWKEFFHPCVTSSYRKGRVNVTEWLPEGCVFCSQVFVLSPLPRRRRPQITGTGGDTPSKGWTDSGCGWWLLKVRVTLAGRVWSLLVAGSSEWLRRILSPERIGKSVPTILITDTKSSVSCHTNRSVFWILDH